MAKTTSRTIDLEPIDRLEEKIQILIGAIERLRGEQARLADDNARLNRELEAARARVSESESSTAEIAALRTERDQVRARIAEMLDQVESLRL
jgi:regulator of replication initiation timing